MKPQKALSIIIVSYNVKNLLIECLNSVLVTCQGLDYEVIVVDNNSQDGTVEEVRSKHPSIRVIENRENIGFARANNQGYQASSGEYVLLLNPDTVAKPGAIPTLVQFMRETPDAGLAACRLANPDGSLQRSIKKFPSVTCNLLTAFFLERLAYPHAWKRTHFRDKPFRIDYPSGAFMMVRREAIEGGELLNPEYFMYSEERDLAFRLKRQKWAAYFVPTFEITHFGEQSTRQMECQMYLELQRSALKSYYLNYPAPRAYLLALSHWMILFNRYLLLYFLHLFMPNNKHRIFKTAIERYPMLMKEAQTSSAQNKDLFFFVKRAFTTRPYQVAKYAKEVMLFTLNYHRFRTFSKKNVTIGASPHIATPGLFKLERPWASIEIGDHFLCYYNCSIHVYHKGRITFGNYCSIGSGTVIHCRSSITIGNYVLLGPEVYMFDVDGHPTDPAERRKEVEYSRSILLPKFGGHGPVRYEPKLKAKPIIIEDDVWIGARTVIMKGVRIGKGSVIAAGSVIIRDVPKGSLVFGSVPQTVPLDFVLRK